MEKEGKKKCVEPWAPAEGQLWLMHGDFRFDDMDEGMVGYHVICASSDDMYCGFGGDLKEDRFHHIALCVIKELLENKPSAVTVYSSSKAKEWAEEKALLKRMCGENNGEFLETCGKRGERFVFIFSQTLVSFLKETYMWTAEHIYESSSEYRLLEDVDNAPLSIPQIQKKAVMRILLDDVHLVIRFQLSENLPLKVLTDALRAACEKEGWSFFTKEDQI